MERTLEDAIHISDRFAPEPVFGPTGKGSYKSADVEGLKEDIARDLIYELNLSPMESTIARSAASHYVAGVLRLDELTATLAEVNIEP